MKRDFAQLYSQLGLRPDCTLDEFKRAYRRRIAALHPDKGQEVDTPENHALLPDLIKLYTTATRFHQRHGRLPGARPSLAPPRPSAAATASRTASATTHPYTVPTAPTNSSGDDMTNAERQSHRGTPLGLALLMLALAVVLAWNLPPPNTELASADATPGDLRAVAIATDVDSLQLGMDKPTVLAIQGEPLRVDDDDEWNYGPSWVRFERGRLVDWHSSQLRPLKTDAPAPPPPDEAVVAARR
ncbi:MAG: DnaJ domain-containing protein [Lysobacter sp.]